MILWRSYYLKNQKEKINSNLSLDYMNTIAKQSFNIDITNFINEHIVEGNTIAIASPLIDSLERKEYTTFDYGFDFISSMKKEIIVGVKENSNASKSGLKNGSKLTGINGITSTPNGEMILETEINNTKSIVKYSPQGSKISIPLIRKLKTIDNT